MFLIPNTFVVVLFTLFKFQQNDIQELLRVLFDALETCFTRGGLASDAEKGKINKLYQGTITDYIRCCKCGFTSSRQDAFLDIPLVIRGMKSIDESIRAYIAPEVPSITQSFTVYNSLTPHGRYWMERISGIARSAIIK